MPCLLIGVHPQLQARSLGGSASGIRSKEACCKPAIACAWRTRLRVKVFKGCSWLVATGVGPRGRFGDDFDGDAENPEVVQVIRVVLRPHLLDPEPVLARLEQA